MSERPDTKTTIPPGMITAVAMAIHNADYRDPTKWPGDPDAPRLADASPEKQALRLEQAEAAVSVILGWKDVGDDR